MKFPDRFWVETTPRLTDAALAALLQTLLRPSDDLPVGVIKVRPLDFEATRFAWAATQIAGELAHAPGVTSDLGTGLAVVWAIAERDLPRGPGPAIAAGRRVGATLSSWTKELGNRIGSQLSGEGAVAFLKGLKESIEIRKLKPQRPRPRADPFEPMLAVAKKRERHLRAEFDGVDDLGEAASAADRLAFVKALSVGYSDADLLRALDGRAVKCRRSRMYQGGDTAETFLRIAWVFAEKWRIDDAIRAAPAAVEDNVIVRGPGGTFVGGRQLVESPAVPAAEVKFEDPEDALGILRNWGKNHSERPEE